ncbi:MAG TPA: acyl-CoA dehydrogenase family protein [Solirubrobacteraceae bacterium]|nr:acyl-CoA dehydrogenase family protein [Solirubrobacteraceae bacterium]
MTIAVDHDQEFLTGIRAIADEVARAHADEVDRDARFPIEAVSALRDARALSALVPPQYGGGGASLGAIAQACFELGRRCSATAMVFAMHQIQVATIVRHLEGAWFEGYLRELARDQRLIASITSEIGTGGDMSRSIAPVRPGDEGALSFEKQAPTVSYGAHADDYLTTVRRSEEAGENDQILVLTSAAQTRLEQTGTWDTIGMRGTCSPGFTVNAAFGADQILAAPFSAVLSETHVPISHILWSHVWLGIATDAFERARAFVRAAARRAPGKPVPAAQSLSRVMSELAMLRAEVRAGLEDYETAYAEPERESLATMGSVLRFNNLKLAASEQAPRICAAVLEVIGIAAYKNDSPYGVGRHLRDSLSARLMVANERIHAVDAGLLLISKEV